MPQKKIVIKKIVVRKVKRIRGFADEKPPDEHPTSDIEKDSDSDLEGSSHVTKRSKLVNQNMLNRFSERQTGMFIEAEAPQARETPLISKELMDKMKSRREKMAAANAENSPLSRFDSEMSVPESPAPEVSTPVSTPLLGEMISFSSDKENVPHHRMPMWCNSEYVHSNRYVRMHDESIDLVKYLKPTHEEEVMRKRVVLEMSDISESLFEGSRVVTFGSIVTGLILPVSDVDMTVVWSGIPDQSDPSYEQCLHSAMDKLADHIAKKGICEEAYPQVIKQTKVPIVKFTHKETWIDVDISFNSPNGRINSEMVVAYCKQHPVAAPLVMLVKYFLQQRSMNEPFTGGLGSYAVSLMVVSFLQHHGGFQAGSDPSAVGLGGLLMDFFRHYVLFDYQNIGVSVRDRAFFRKTREQQNDRATFLLVDPQNDQNNVTASSRQLSSIRSAFHHAFLALDCEFPYVPEAEQSAEHPNIKNRPTILSRIIHIDHAMLDRRNKVTQAYEVWAEKNPTLSANDFLTRFDEQQISGPDMRQYLKELGAIHDDEEVTDIQDENDDVYVL
eukprot:TRINITY_DN4399_c0_g1_i2.p1 TRINITY_DN4399_c0_g1~~TRINITY_DN4399_c0_g1_i2.p1  ORF type:complete len:575 (+),score=101.76 TRINITY_DN4399_c0_g1_i2:57-1727(+)